MLNQMDNQRVAKYVKKKAKSKGIRIVLDHKNKYLDGDITVGSEAYFSDDGVAKVSTLHEDWGLNLLHEYCHGEQWKENCKVWRKSYMMGSDAYDIADRWIKGDIELTVGERYDVFFSLYDVERDCEARVITHLSNILIDVDISLYVQRAWAYINSYMYSCMIREWLPAHMPPYSHQKLVGMMPTNMHKEIIIYNPEWWKLYEEAYPSLKKPNLSWGHRNGINDRVLIDDIW